MISPYINQLPLKKLGLAALMAIFLLTCLPHKAGATAAYYTNSPLISDSIYLNAQSMSPAQIQSFLAGKSSYLTNYYVTESSTNETLSYYPNYNKSVLVSQAIYDAAQVYGINPQAILATMQKEESLVTDQSPTTSQLKFAMGYGCPDSSGCTSAAAGLFYQIDNGTWDLRYLFERARGNTTWWNNKGYACSGSNTTYYSPGLYPGNNVSFFDDAHTNYTTFVIANAATAALYCYTPHAYPGSSAQYYSGSYNFVVAFTNWFGSAISGIQLEQAPSTTTVYAVYGGMKQAIPSTDVLAAWGLDQLPVSSIDATYLNSLPDRGILTRLAKNPSSSSQYLIADQKGTFDALANMVTDWGMDPNSASTIGPELLTYTNRLGSLSEFVATPGSGGIYMVDNGTSRQFSSGSTFASWDGTMPVSTVSSALLGLLTSGNGVYNNRAQAGTNQYLLSNGNYLPLSSGVASVYPAITPTTVSSALINVMPNGGGASRFVKASGNTVYLVDGGTKRGFTSGDLLGAYLGSGDSITTLSDSELATIPDGAAITSRFIYNGADTTKQYYVNNGITMLSPVFNDSGYGQSLSAAGINLINNTGTISCAQGLIQATNSPTVYIMDGGVRRGIPSGDVLSMVSNTTASRCTLSPSDMAQIPLGNVISPFVSNGGTNYLTEGNAVFSVSSSVASALGISSFTPVSAAYIANYQAGGALASSFRAGSSYVYASAGSYLTTTDAATAGLWGVSNSSQTHSATLLKFLNYGGPLTKFVTGKSGQTYASTIFTVANGKLWGIRTIDNALNLGYNGSTTALDQTTIASLLAPSAWQGYLAIDDEGSTWVVDGGIRHLVPSGYQTAWASGQTPSALGDAYLALIPVSSPISNAIRTTSNPTFYGLRSGAQYAIPSSSVYANSGLAQPSIVSTSLENSVPNGGYW